MEKKNTVGNWEMLLTHLSLEVLEEPVQDDASHQRGRQIHLRKFDRQKESKPESRDELPYQ